MSSVNSEAEAVDTTCCASCGIAEVDDTKLVPCDGCDLVKYCSDSCRQDHRSQHEVACKVRAAALRDEILFKQPESSFLGDCPICFLPFQINNLDKPMLSSCCSTYICEGCAYAHLLRKIDSTCPFCRHPVPATDEETRKNDMKRVAANDPLALMEFGREIAKKDKQNGFKYLTKAAELGNADAHYELSVMYEKDEMKEMHHLEKAAIRGHPDARYNLGVCEENNGRVDRAVKHWIIAANLGHDPSIQALKNGYKYGDVTKDDFAAALRAHHAAVKATKSPQRETAAKFYAVHRRMARK